MPDCTAEGSWCPPSLAGGCPKHDSWPQNPQYRLVPHGTEAQQCEITLSCGAKLPIGFVVLRSAASDVGGRKAVATKLAGKDVVVKTKWKAVGSMSATCAIPPLAAGQGYVILPSTFEPGSLGSFELRVSSDEPFTLEPLQPPSAPAGAATAPPNHLSAARMRGAEMSAATPSGPLPTPSPVVTVREGQGLSTQQERDKEAMIAEALAQCTASGRKYEDPHFAPAAKALWRDGTAPGAELGMGGGDPVTSWLRPEEFATEPRLFVNDWQVLGVAPSVLPNTRLLAAANIVAGDPDVIKRVYLSTEHAAHGFYVLRFFQEDPRSDDDWKVVLVDDRLPCGADGKPCFGHNPSEGVLWAAIVEKGLAKLLGSYEATCHVGVEDGLVLLTGRITKEIELGAATAQVQQALLGDNAAGLWQELSTAWSSAHCVGVEHRAQPGDEPAEMAATGLLANVCYCAATGGHLPPGRMVRLRGLAGVPEWTGKWSDEDPGWTSQLRQLMQFSKDAQDGTFWMGFEDVAHWFNTFYFCRPADDMWMRMAAKSAWVDLTAGGSPNAVSWRHNPQWLLTVAKPTRVLITLSVLTELAAPPPIGLYVLRGNPHPHARRRKLTLSQGDVIEQVEPKFSSRLSTELVLSPPAAGEPPHYIIMPYAYLPGAEMDFSLVVRADISDAPKQAADNQASLAPVTPDEDWRFASSVGTWADTGGGGGAPGGPGGDLSLNPQIRLAVHGQAKGRFLVMVQSSGVLADMRTQEGMQQAAAYPALGLALAAGSESGAPLAALPAAAHVTPAEATDGVVLECELEPSATAYVLMPFLQEPARAMTAAPGLRYTLTVFSDVEFALGGGGGSRDHCGYELCCFCGKSCAPEP